MAATIAVVVRAHWVSGWFLRAFAVPFVLVDGTERRVTWERIHRVEVQPGHRVVGAGIRYRRQRRLLGYRPITVRMQPEGHVRLMARNGPLNSEPFRITVLPHDRSPGDRMSGRE